MNTKKNIAINFSRKKIIDILQDKTLLEDTFDLINSIAKDGKREILNYYRRKGINRDTIAVSKKEISDAVNEVSPETVGVFKDLLKQVEILATKERTLITEEFVINDDAYFKSILYTKPLDVIGIYIPRNLPSSLIYYCTFAKVAGVRKIIVALPPDEKGRIDPLLLAAASMLNIDRIIAVGGRSAFPSLAFGLGGEIPNKLFGPCSLYVDHVKQILECFYKVPVDIPSGPSELLIYIEDEKYVEQAVLDIRAQMEHGEDSVCFVVSTKNDLLKCISNATKDISSKVICQVVQNKDRALKFINEIAPEILEIFTDDPESMTSGLKNVANVYINICSPLGDYCYVGKGCADPTFGMAKGVSGITMDSFFKKSCINYSKTGKLKPSWASKLAGIEKFKYHKMAIDNFLSSRNKN
jgi:histidinol dehydrogenase